MCQNANLDLTKPLTTSFVITTLS